MIFSGLLKKLLDQDHNIKLMLLFLMKQIVVKFTLLLLININMILINFLLLIFMQLAQMEQQNGLQDSDNPQ